MDLDISASVPRSHKHLKLAIEDCDNYKGDKYSDVLSSKPILFKRADKEFELVKNDYFIESASSDRNHKPGRQILIARKSNIDKNGI